MIKFFLYSIETLISYILVNNKRNIIFQKQNNISYINDVICMRFDISSRIY